MALTHSVTLGSGVRLVYFIRTEPIYGDPYYNFSDSVTNVIIWSIIEICFSIIAANLPYVLYPKSFHSLVL